ncbi:hypothetical protein RCL1_006320 [Eukaryota sp. TZLM3-RCL]
MFLPGQCPCSCAPHSNTPGVYAVRGTPHQRAPALNNYLADAERRIFMENISAFNEKRKGPTLLNPRLGHTEIDLFHLYRQVTFRGGLEAVVQARSFRQVADSIGIPETATNAGYLLKKHYIQYLYAYELVHYWGASLSDAFAHQKPPEAATPAPQHPSSYYPNTPSTPLPFPMASPSLDSFVPPPMASVQVEDLISRPLFKYDYTAIEPVDLVDFEQEPVSLYEIVANFATRNDKLVAKSLNLLLKLSCEPNYGFFPGRYPLILENLLKISEKLVENEHHYRDSNPFKAFLVLRNLAQIPENAKIFGESFDYQILVTKLLKIHNFELLTLTSLEFFASISAHLSLVPEFSTEPKPYVDILPLLQPLVQYLLSSNLNYSLAASTALVGLCFNPINEDTLMLNSRNIVPVLSSVLSWSQLIIFESNSNDDSNFEIYLKLHYNVLLILFYFSEFDVTTNIQVCRYSVVQNLMEILEKPFAFPTHSRIAMKVVRNLVYVRQNSLMFRSFFNVFVKCACSLGKDYSDYDGTMTYDPQTQAIINEIRYTCSRIAFSC